MEIILAFAIGISAGAFAAILLLRGIITNMRAESEAKEIKAYAGGIRDGYGYAKSPWEPEFHEAGEYLKAKCSGEWPELADDDD